MEKSGKTIVRNFRKSDAWEAAEVVVDSFMSKLKKLLDLPEDRIVEFLLESGAVPSLPFPGNIVAERNGKVVGVILLNWKGQKRPKEKHSMIKLTGRFGLRNALRFIALAIKDRMESPKKGECYIEHLAVRGDARRKGIGTRLLRFGKKVAAENGCRRYYLDAAVENIGAIRLYKREGFRIERKVCSWLLDWLIDYRDFYYMSQIV